MWPFTSSDGVPTLQRHVESCCWNTNSSDSCCRFECLPCKSRCTFLRCSWIMISLLFASICILYKGILSCHLSSSVHTCTLAFTRYCRRQVSQDTAGTCLQMMNHLAQTKVLISTAHHLACALHRLLHYHCCYTFYKEGECTCAALIGAPSVRVHSLLCL